jgi:hypothetical protein
LAFAWRPAGVTLSRDIRVVERPKFNEDDWRFWNLRRTDEQRVEERLSWLCIERECEYHDREGVFATMAETLRSAALGLQLWVPKGWDGIIIASESAGRVERVWLPEPYPDSKWGRMIDAENLDTSAAGAMVEGTLKAFESGEVPVINPFQFLEIGLQTAMNHRRAGMLLWITGLDGLLAAEKRDVFVARLSRLLGRDTPVFPQDWVGRKPVYTVGQVAGRIFEWRGLVAHGKKILKRFREPITFEFQPKDLEYLRVENWTEETLIEECALFCLIGALRKIIESGLMPIMAKKREWDRWLDGDSSR